MFHARRVGRQRREERGEHERNTKKREGRRGKTAGKVPGKSCFLEGHSLYNDFWSKASRIFSALPKNLSLSAHLSLMSPTSLPHIRVQLVK